MYDTVHRTEDTAPCHNQQICPSTNQTLNAPDFVSGLGFLSVDSVIVPADSSDGQKDLVEQHVVIGATKYLSLVLILFHLVSQFVHATTKKINK